MNISISEEKIYYRINDTNLPIFRQLNMSLYKDHGNYYCIISMKQLYKLFQQSSRIYIKYYCSKCGKISLTDCQNLTLKLKKCDGKLWCSKCTRRIKRKSILYEYRPVPTGKQQIFFYNMFKEISILNYPLEPLHIDIAFVQLQIGIMYKSNTYTSINNYQKIKFQKPHIEELRQQRIFIRTDWKFIYIISPNNKINKYTENEYIQIFNYCYYLFYIQNEKIIELYIENDYILTQNYIIYIKDILLQFISAKKNIILSIDKAINYLHISRRTLYYKKKYLIHKTWLNRKYCIQSQLDKLLYPVKTSKQQIYFYNLFNRKLTKLNCAEGALHIDIAFPRIKMGIEYNGGGHDLDLKLSNITLKEFITREWRRRYVLIKQDWKIIYIVSPKDKINNYTNEEYIKIFNYCYQLFQNQDNKWIEIYIENNIILTSTSLTYITDILNNKNISQKIYNLTETAKYLHIAKRTIYKLQSKNKLIMNKTPYNMKYYMQSQLDEYIKLNGKVDNNYLLIEETSKYLNTPKAKINVLKQTRELYPYIINDEEYYLKSQLDEILKNKILDKYVSSKEACKYLNISSTTLQYRIAEKLITPIAINNIYYFNKTDLPAINTLQQKEAAEYLNISTKQLNVLVNSNQLTCKIINHRRAYMRDELDNYLNRQKALKEDLSNKFFTLKDAAKYLNIKYKNFAGSMQYKFNITIINNRKYISKQQVIDYKDLSDNIKDKNKYLSVQDITEYLNIHKNTARELCKKYQLKYIEYNDSFYYKKTEVDELIKNRQNNKDINSNINKEFISLDNKHNSSILLGWKKYKNLKIDNNVLNINEQFYTAEQIKNVLNISIENENIPYMISNFNHKWYNIDEILQFFKTTLINLLTKTKAAEYLQISASDLFNLQLPSIIENSTVYYKYYDLIKYKFFKDKLSTKQAANLCNANMKNIRFWAKQEYIKPVQIDNQYYFDKKQIEQWNIDKNKILTKINKYNDKLIALRAAKYLHISPVTLAKLTVQGTLKAEIINNYKYYKISDLDKYLENINQIKDLYYTTHEAAEKLNIKYSILLKKLKNTLPFNIQTIDGQWYILKEEIHKYIEILNIYNTSNFNLNINYIKQCLMKPTVKLPYTIINNNKYYDVNQICELLDIKYTSLNYQLTINEFPFKVELIDNQRYFLKNKIDEYIEQRQILYTRLNNEFNLIKLKI